MTSLDLLKAIGDVDETLLIELDQNSYGGQRKVLKSGRKYFLTGRSMFAAAVLAACTLFLLCSLWEHIRAGMYLKKGGAVRDYCLSAPEHIQEDTADDKDVAEEKQTVTSENEDKAISGELPINYLDSLYANAKFGGSLKEVSEKQWQEQYGKTDFLERNPQCGKGYYLSYSKQKEVLYGLLHLRLSDCEIEMRVGDGEMLDSPFESLKKTKMGGYEIAVCQSGSGREVNYSAIVQAGDVFYTMEESEMTLQAFEDLVERIFAYE